MSFRDLERKIEIMPVPNETNQQDNYDQLMAQAMDPSNHPVDNLPDATQQHDGTNLGTQAPGKFDTQMNPMERKAPTPQHTQAKRAPGGESGNTKTRGKKKK